jgi:hypothetical protein
MATAVSTLLPAITTGPYPRNPLPDDPSLKKGCPQDEAGAQSSAALCHDTPIGQALHKGTCYRQMVKPGSPGLHCCYEGGKLAGLEEGHHTDQISPVDARLGGNPDGSGGECSYGTIVGAKHVIVEAVPVIYKRCEKWLLNWGW